MATSEDKSPDWDIVSAAAEEPVTSNTEPSKYTEWRIYALYGIICFLMIVIFINLGLSLWLLSVMRFSKEGIGPIHIISGGIKLSGKALFADSLVASTIASRSGQPIRLESYRNITIDTKDAQGNSDNTLFIGRSRFQCQSSSFKITDNNGKVLFSADPQEVSIGADSLSVSGEGGILVDGSVQAPLVKSDSGQELRLESPTRSLEVHAPSSVMLESRAGTIIANSYADLKLESLTGANDKMATAVIASRDGITDSPVPMEKLQLARMIRLDSKNVFIKKLEVAAPPDSVPRSKSRRHGDVYQLCACADGKLFLANPRGSCETYIGDYVCI